MAATKQRKKVVTKTSTKPEAPERAETSERLSELVLSEDLGNVMLAFKMMAGQTRAPVGVFEALLVVMHDVDAPKKAREGAKSLFADQAPRSLKEAVASVLEKTTLFRGNEDKRRERIAALAEQSGGVLDALRLARALFTRKLGWTFLLDHAHATNDAELVHFVVEGLREDQTLDLSGGGLTDLPDAFANETDIETLELGSSMGSRNRLRKIPKGLLALTSIVSLDLSDNAVAEFPPRVTTWPRLETLDLKGHGFSEVPEGLASLTSLRVLRLGASVETVGMNEKQAAERSRRRALSLSPSLAQLVNLEELELGWLTFPDLPGWMAAMKLEVLDLQHAWFDQAPMVLAKMPALKRVRSFGMRVDDKAGWAALRATLEKKGVKLGV